MLTGDTSLLGQRQRLRSSHTASSLSFMSAPVLLGATQRDPRGCCTCSGSVSQLRSPGLRKSKSFTMGRKHSAKTVLQRETQPLSSEAIHCTDTLEKAVQNKSHQDFCWQDVQKFEGDPWGIVSRSTSLIGPVLFCWQFSLLQRVLSEHFSVCFLA